MNIVPKMSGRRGKVLRLEITSMVDVIFLLLIYFLLATSHTPPESDLSPALQAERVSGGKAADFAPQVIEVSIFDGEPGFKLGNQILRNREALIAVLRELPTEGGLFVRGANRATVGWAVTAIQAARDEGFEKVTYVPGE